jgi:hypothetical protein
MGERPPQEILDLLHLLWLEGRFPKRYGRT